MWKTQFLDSADVTLAHDDDPNEALTVFSKATIYNEDDEIIMWKTQFLDSGDVTLAHDDDSSP